MAKKKILQIEMDQFYWVLSVAVNITTVSGCFQTIQGVAVMASLRVMQTEQKDLGNLLGNAKDKLLEWRMCEWLNKQNFGALKTSLP